jgi:hypothetical protein
MKKSRDQYSITNSQNHFNKKCQAQKKDKILSRNSHEEREINQKNAMNTANIIATIITRGQKFRNSGDTISGQDIKNN